MFTGRLMRRLRALLRRDRLDDELEEELRYHLARQAELYAADGLSHEQARLSALRDFGGLERAKELCRNARGVRLVEDLREDVRLAWRRLRKSPGFAAVAVLTLALGIGANTALFTLVSAVMFKPLPVANPDQLYRLGDLNDWFDAGGLALENPSLYSYPLYRHLRDSTSEFTDLAAFQPVVTNLAVRRAGDDYSAPFGGEFVSGNYFRTLGVAACAGRTLTPDDDRADAQPVALVSYRAWQHDYNLDPSLIGGTLVINTRLVKIVGVTPPGFFGETLRGDPPDFWLPIADEPTINPIESRLDQPDLYWLYAVGRLRPGARTVQAQAKITSEVRRWLFAQDGVTDEDRSQIAKAHVALTPMGGGINRLADDTKGIFGLLAALSALVLLIAWTTVANLLLARSASDRLQMAVRATLGAPRARLFRQVLTEGLLLASIGSLAGLAAAFAGARAFLSTAFSGVNYVPVELNPSAWELLFACLLVLLTGIACSAVPASLASRAQTVEVTRCAQLPALNRRALPQKLLLGLQVTLSLVLLTGAGLLAETSSRLERQRFGFETSDRLIVNVDPALAGYTPDRLADLYRQLRERLTSVPGVRSVSFSAVAPMCHDKLFYWAAFNIKEGRPSAESDTPNRALVNQVSPHFFETIGTRLLRGRAIDERDTPTSPHVAVVNEAFARQLSIQDEPLGKHVNFFGAHGQTGEYEIVGVVEDAQYSDQRRWHFNPSIFLPLMQLADFEDRDSARSQLLESYIRSVQLRVGEHGDDIEPTIRRTLADIDPNLVVLGVRNFGDQVSSNFHRERLVAGITTLYGLLVVALAAVGLYGVASYSVVRRTKEVGVRIALGARRADVIALMLRDALAPIAVGLLAGIPCALACGRAITDRLYGVKSYDPLVLTTAVVILAGCATLAALVPSLRAASIDPVRALKTD